MVMHSRRAAGRLMLGALASPVLLPAAAGAREARRSSARVGVVTGRTVTRVQTPESRFQLGPMRIWTETSGSSVRFSFVERARDERSVYLSDASRGVRLQIDVARALVLYADESAPQMRPLYPITRSDAVVNGRNLVYARVPSGQYLMTDTRVWVERGDDGAEFTFVEAGRDEGAVQIVDAARGVQLQLDPGRMLVSYADTGASGMRTLYTITDAAAITA